jgi:2-dehydro-3-deoxyphosphooctonate aldolase (KDO 8-P synthase)
MSSYFSIDNVDLKRGHLFFILGPCVIESEEMVLEIAGELRRLVDETGIQIIFKASFDKANRSSLSSYRGPGLDEGLRILKRAKDEYHLPVLADIHEPGQAEAAARVLSALQIPAFLCRQTDLLLAAGRTGLPVNVKKGQFMAAEDMSLVVEKIRSTGNERVMLTERGNFFGYRNLVVDFRNIPLMKKSGLPVVIDATHSVQRPTASGGVSGGDPEYIPMMAAAGIVSGADGVFMEVHPDPAAALSDGSNALSLKNLKPLLIKLKKLYNSNL